MTDELNTTQEEPVESRNFIHAFIEVISLPAANSPA